MTVPEPNVHKTQSTFAPDQLIQHINVSDDTIHCTSVIVWDNAFHQTFQQPETCIFTLGNKQEQASNIVQTLLK